MIQDSNISKTIPQDRDQVTPQFKVQNGFLVTADGQRRFVARQGGKVIRDEVLLRKIANMMNKRSDLKEAFEVSQNQAQNDEISVQRPLKKVHISITKDSILVKKESSDENAVKNIEDEKIKKHFESITQLIENQDRFIEDITQFCKEKKFTQSALQEAIHHILDEVPHDIKHVGTWHENTLSDILHGYGNEALRTALTSLSTHYQPKPEDRCTRSSAKDCEKLLREQILEKMTRNPKEISFPGENGEITYVQKFYKTEKDQEGFLLNRGHSALYDKRVSPEDHGNSNLGSIITNGSDECILTRSGRSNSFKRLEELVRHAAIEQMSVTNKKGLKKLEDGTYEFTHHVTSYLDSSSLKAIPALFQKIGQIFKKDKVNPDNEREQLQQILCAVDTWPKEGIEIQLENKTKIILKKPIVSEELFSRTVLGLRAKSVGLTDLGYSVRDRIEMVNGLRLLKFAIAEKKLDYNRGNRVLLDIYEKLVKISRDSSLFGRDLPYEELMNGSSPISKALDDPELKTMLAEFLIAEAHKNNVVAEALYTVIFRMELPDANAEKKMRISNLKEQGVHAADLEIWRNYLDDTLNISKGKQCKSGTDRTAVGVALAVAAAQFKKETTRDFLPIKSKKENTNDTDIIIEDANQENDELRFKMIYYRVLREFGLSITPETRGYSGLKLMSGAGKNGGKANPVAMKYLFNEDDLQEIQFEEYWKRYFPDEEIPKKPFVTVTREKLEKGGLEQYDGTMSDSYLLGAKILVGENSKQVTLENIRITEREDSMKEVVGILRGALGENFPYNDADIQKIFSPNLKIIPHIKLFGFSKSPEKRENQIKEIQNKIDTLSNQNKDATSYILKHILWLEKNYYEGRSRIKSQITKKI